MLSDRGAAFIEGFEELRLEAYPDPGTGGDPWTVGYGHTANVSEGDTCTEAEADQWLKEDCRDAEAYIDEHVTVDLNQNQRDALISFVFNVGAGNFKGSTLLRLINAGNFAAAAQQFIRWNRAAGQVLLGLTRRRMAEANLFMEPI